MYASYSSGNTTGIGAYISAAADANWNGTETPSRITFATAPVSSVTPVERMRIDSSGNVGIGTTGPNYALSVHTADAGGSWIQITDSDTGTGGGDGFLVGVNGDENAALYNAEATDMIFSTSALARMTIKAGGNVGIGTNNPTQRLQIASGSNTMLIRLTDTATAYGSTYFQQYYASLSDRGLNIWNDAATKNWYFKDNGDFIIDGSYNPFTAAHPAQLIDDEVYHYGELVQTQGLIQSGKDIVYQVNKTTGSYQRNVLGAFGYVEDPSLNNTPVSRSSAEAEYVIYVLGDGHILCNGEKGNLAVGDGICSSTTVGQGMKADKMAMCIGIAQATASFTGSETQLVPVQYGLQQFTPWTD